MKQMSKQANYIDWKKRVQKLSMRKKHKFLRNKDEDEKHISPKKVKQIKYVFQVVKEY